MSTTAKNDREAFERYMRRENPGTPLERLADGYMHPFADDTWHGFKAGAKAARAEAGVPNG